MTTNQHPTTTPDAGTITVVDHSSSDYAEVKALFPSGRTCTITVYMVSELWMRDAATISWPSLGEVSVADAATYAQAMATALLIAGA